MTRAQFQELVLFEEMYPAGDELMDRRFALLASLIACGLQVKSLDGKAYAVQHFLKSLHGDEDKPREPVKQSVEQQIKLLDAWMGAQNIIYAEKHSARH